MENFREKSQVFLLGVMVGLIIAGGFFILKLDNYFNQLNLYKNITKTLYLSSKKDKPDSLQEEVLHYESEKSTKREKKKSLVVENNNNSDASKLTEPSAQDSSSTDLLDDEYIEEIVVEKDEMVASANMQIINLNPLTASEHSSDSLLQKVSGVRDDKNNAKRAIMVELWKSPLHYKGYKMSKNKLLLYGFPSLEGVKISKLDDVIYLKSAGIVYRLDQTYDFKPYQYVDEQSIVNKLK